MANLKNLPDPDPELTAAKRLMSRRESITGAAKLTLRYPDGARDAEAMFVDPRSGEIYVIQKAGAGGWVGIYRAPANLAAGSTTVMTKVGTLTLPTGGSNAVTAGTFAADASEKTVRFTAKTGRYGD